MGPRSHGAKATHGRTLAMPLTGLPEGLCPVQTLSRGSLLEGSRASAQMLDMRTRSFTLLQAEILETILKVAINARLPIYKDGKVTDHFKIVYVHIVFLFHVSICRFVSIFSPKCVPL